MSWHSVVENNFFVVFKRFKKCLMQSPPQAIFKNYPVNNLFDRQGKKDSGLEIERYLIVNCILLNCKYNPTYVHLNLNQTDFKWKNILHSD